MCIRDSPGSEGTLKTIAEKPHKRIAYEAAVKDAMNEPADGATTMKKKAAEKLAAKAAPAPVQAESETVEAVVPTSEATEVAEVLETPAETVEAPAAEATPEAAAE